MKQMIITFFCSLGLLFNICHADEVSQLAQQLNNIAQNIQQPIAQNDQPLYIDTPLEFSDNSEWADINKQIRETPNKQIVIRIQGIGGITLFANGFIQAILDAQAKGKTIVMDIIGPSYSMHAFVSCFGTKTMIRPGASLMFHSMGEEDSYLFGLVSMKDIKLDKSTQVQEDTEFNQCKKMGILNDSDIETIKNGNDVIISNVDGKLIKSTESDAATISTLKDIFNLVVVFSLMLLFLILIKRV